VGDQLIAYLAQAAHWVDQPASRLALGKLSPKVRAAVLAHPEARLASEQRETAALAKREAYAGFLPQVSANVETGNRNTDLVNTPWSYVPAHQDNSKAIAITGRQLLYDFGAVSNQVDARGALETAAAARSQVRRVSGRPPAAAQPAAASAAALALAPTASASATGASR